MLPKVNKTNPGIEEHAINSFEVRCELKLPKAYREFLLTTNGGRPVPSAFPIQGLPDNPIGVIQAFFGLNANIRAHDLEVVLGDLLRFIPPGLLPIACTDGDDFVCLDLRSPGAPVVFWDRRPFWGTNVWNDSDLFPIAHSFDALLESLSNHSAGA